MMVIPTDRTIEDVIKDCCPHPHEYCFLKEIVKLCGINDRVLEQIECIEKFRYERNQQNMGDMDLDEARILWEKEGFAKRFAEVYKEGIKNNELYGLIMGRNS